MSIINSMADMDPPEFWSPAQRPALLLRTRPGSGSEGQPLGAVESHGGVTSQDGRVAFESTLMYPYVTLRF